MLESLFLEEDLKAQYRPGSIEIARIHYSTGTRLEGGSLVLVEKVCYKAGRESKPVPKVSYQT